MSDLTLEFANPFLEKKFKDYTARINREFLIGEPLEGGIQSLDHLVDVAGNNPFFKKVKEDMLEKSVAAALGEVYSKVLDAAVPNLVGRLMLDVIPTTESTVRFPIASKVTGKRVGQGYEGWIIGEHYDTTDIDTDIIYKMGAQWTISFLEDASWAVMQRQVAEVGRSVAEVETVDIIALFDAIAEANLAGGANYDVAASGTLTWADVIGGWNKLEGVDRHATLCVMHPNEYTDLWNDDKFIHSFYFGSQADLARGILGGTYLGFKIVKSSLINNDYVYLIDVPRAGALCVRSDITTMPFANNAQSNYGVVARERVGMGMLDNAAIQRIDVTP